MSYEILYGRQFVSLGDGTYIPMILSGTNNRTMIRYGREILERYWWVMGQGNCLAKTEEELVQWMILQTEKNPSREWFMRSGKWLTASDMVHWMVSGVKSARTIEEIKERLPSQFLHCSIIVYDESKSHKSVGYRKNENDQFIHTTEDLKKWIEEFKKRRKEKGSQERVYPNIEFYGYEPLGLGAKTAPHNAPVICKIGNGYLYAFDVIHNRHIFGPDITKAIVFDNIKDFEEKTKGAVFAKYRLIKANQPEKNFVIKINGGRSDGMYFQQKTSKQMTVTQDLGVAKKFFSERSAQNYIERELKGKFEHPISFIIDSVKANE